MVANVVYVLCTATSLLCGVMLYRGYRNSGARLLFWSALCFFALALNNALLLIDLRVVPEIDLSAWRIAPAIAGAGALIYGLIWEDR
jgi:hypothetical protein